MRIYYRILGYFIHNGSSRLPESMAQKKNLFLYFDYEREFGNSRANISDTDVFKILDVLDHYQVKTTWFTVGKIFSKYPESIEEILKRGHEIGSHTYSHIKLLNSSSNKIKKDFSNFHRASVSFTAINGFHSPNGKWSYQTIKNLRNYNFKYDVISIPKRTDCNYYNIRNFTKRDLIRIFTLGDDYSLLNKRYNAKEVFQHFHHLYQKIEEGKLAGIGFHPWVLFSDNMIWQGFIEFITFLSTEKDLNIDTAFSLVSQISKK